MKRKRITAILTVIFICAALICIPTLADDQKTWRQKADNSNIDVTYSGRVTWKDKGIVPNVVTYYANLTGKDIKFITIDNPATLIIKSGTFQNTLVNCSLHYGDVIIIHTTSKSTTAASIIVNWAFDGYRKVYTME